MDFENLGGRIERAKIVEAKNSIYGLGELRGVNEGIYIKNAVDFVGQEVLVKIAMHTNMSYCFPRVNFLARHIPEDFPQEGIRDREAVLYGRWIGNSVPSLDELNKKYDPGHIGAFLYVGKDRFFIEENEGEISSPDFWDLAGQYFDKMPTKPGVVIFEGKNNDYRPLFLNHVLEKKGRFPIRMDELDRTKSSLQYQTN